MLNSFLNFCKTRVCHPLNWYEHMSRPEPDGCLEHWRPVLRRSSAFLAALLHLSGLSPRIFAQDFHITQARLDSNNRPRVEFAGSATNYYVLHRGNDVLTITNPVALLLGSDGPMEFTGAALAPAPSAVFFRVHQIPLTQPADSDGDGIDDLWEFYRAGTLNPLDPADAQRIAPSGKTYLLEYQAATFPPPKLVETSPANGESGVAVTRETIFRFNHPLAPTTLLGTNNLRATFGGRQILARIELSTDRKTVTLFYQEPLPASARVRVTFNGTNLTDYLGRALDLDGDGQPGGNAIVDFDTLSITPVAGTAVIGHVFASLQVPVVSTNTTTNFVDHPLPGVLISVIGAEQEIFTTTDAQGFFRLTNCPAGKFFVSIDGRTSPESTWPDGDYYPLVGKPWEVVAGRTNNLAGGNGLIYLPLVQAGTLQPVNPTADTAIGFPANIIAANPAWAGVSVTIPTNALFSDNGTRGGRVGLAPVPADRLPERLPAGIVHALDISIQTDGPQNVDRPLPVRFPNLPDPQTGLKLPPGAKSALMSYNHDTGRWEVQGPMTVTADGNYVETDPGVGARQPGWHGTMPGIWWQIQKTFRRWEYRREQWLEQRRRERFPGHKPAVAVVGVRG